MDNKKALTKLVKIASNQHKILNKLAQVYEDGGLSADSALNDFIKYQVTSWGLPKEVAAKVSHSANRVSGSKHYDVLVTFALTDPNKIKILMDPVDGFATWLSKKFISAPQESKWKALEGYTATFKVNSN